MSNETIIGLLLSIPIAIISGLYAGIIVARYQRFSDLRLQANKIILEIDFLCEGTIVRFTRRKEIPELFTISSDLFFLGHRLAGTKVLEVGKDIQHSLTEASVGRVNYESFNEKYVGWQQQIRALSPEPLPILRIWGGL